MADTRVRRHTPALLGEFDARPFAGSELFQFDGQPVMMPADAGVYSDIISFLNGYGSTPGHDLGSLIQTALRLELGDPAIVAGVTITPGDRVNVYVVGAPDFQLGASSLNEPLGFPAGGVSGYAPSHTAAEPFQRGTVEALGGLVFDFQGVGQVTVPADGTLAPSQSVSALIRSRGSDVRDPEADLAGQALEDRFLTAAPAAYVRARVDASGCVSISWNGGAGDLMISSSELWQRLGGTGMETAEDLGGGAYRLTTANPAPCVLALARGYVELRRMTKYRDRSAVMADGSIVSSGLSPLAGWNLTVRVTGPAFGYSASQETHLRGWWQYARRSLTFFPQWGDLDAPARGSIETRRHRDLLGSGTQPNDPFYTTEADEASSHYARRKGGRLLVRRAPRDSSERAESYGDHALDTVQDLEFRLLDDLSR